MKTFKRLLYSLTLLICFGGIASAQSYGPPVLNVTVSTFVGGSNISCFGASDGFIHLSVTGGTPPYTYAWSTGDTTQNISGLAAGYYTVVVTDSIGQQSNMTRLLSQPSDIDATINVTTAISCNGNSNGAMTVSVMGSTTPYTYVWNTMPVQTTSVATGLAAGTYSVTVTDGHGCSKTFGHTITQPDPLITATATVSNVRCHGDADGALAAYVNGGTAPFSYVWSTSPVQTTSAATHLVAGVYSVTVTDAHGCTAGSIDTVTQPDENHVAAITLANVMCHGGNNGSAKVTACGCNMPYTYVWSTTPQQNDTIATHLVAGIYTVTVTDVHGCIKSALDTITEPPALTATISSKTDASCFGSNNGTMTVTAGGGVAPYTYAWSTTPLQTSSIATDLVAGSYSVTVTDAHGCTKPASDAISQPASALTASTVAGTVVCSGGSTTVTVSGTGGTAPYSGIGTYTVTAGTHNFTVTDAHGCTAMTSVTITDPEPLVASSVAPNILCHGGTTVVTVSATGGVSAYTGIGTFTVHAGTHNYTVTDANGCSAMTSITLTEPSLLVASSVAGNVLCHGGAATVTISATGGTTPYTGTGNFPVSAGTFNYTVTDANGCTATTSVTVTQPSALSLTTSGRSASCNNAADGAAIVSATGGVAPYSYTWDAAAGSQHGDTAKNLPAGMYNVTVTDHNGCIAMASATVTGDVSPLTIATQVTPASCFNANDCSVHLNVSGGTAPYTCTWTGGQTTFALDHIPAGAYSATITDASGCRQSLTVEAGQPDALQAELSCHHYMNGYDVSVHNAKDGSITSAVSGGTSPYKFEWSNGGQTPNLTDLPGGNYTLKVTDEHGCVTYTKIALREPSPLEMPNGYTPNGDGKNDYFVIHGIDAYPNNNMRVFNRWGNEVLYVTNYSNNWNGKNSDGQDLPDGTYYVVVTINNGAIVLKGYVDMRR